MFCLMRTDLFFYEHNLLLDMITDKCVHQRYVLIVLIKVCMGLFALASVSDIMLCHLQYWYPWFDIFGILSF